MSSIVLWGFSYHLCIIDCWSVFSHWLYQCLLILKLVLGCDWKLYIMICFPRRFVEFRGEGAGFFISPVTINTFIGFKVVSQFIQLWSCVVKCKSKGTKAHWVNTSQLFCEWYKAFQNKGNLSSVVYVLIIFQLLIKESDQGEQSPIGYIHWNVFVFYSKNVCDVFMFVWYFFFYSWPNLH